MKFCEWSEWILKNNFFKVLLKLKILWSNTDFEKGEKYFEKNQHAYLWKIVMIYSCNIHNIFKWLMTYNLLSFESWNIQVKFTLLFS